MPQPPLVNTKSATVLLQVLNVREQCVSVSTTVCPNKLVQFSTHLGKLIAAF